MIAIEGNPAAVKDARHNLAADDVKVTRGDVSRWDPVPADVVIADPSRAGLGADVVDRIAATDAVACVLVACDAAALGRDVGLLQAGGYALTGATPVDLFPHTSHVEVVAVLDRVVAPRSPRYVRTMSESTSNRPTTRNASRATAWARSSWRATGTGARRPSGRCTTSRWPTTGCRRR